MIGYWYDESLEWILHTVGVAIEDGGIIYIDGSPIIFDAKFVRRVILNPEVLAYFGFQGTS